MSVTKIFNDCQNTEKINRFARMARKIHRICESIKYKINDLQRSIVLASAFDLYFLQYLHMFTLSLSYVTDKVYEDSFMKP